MIINLSFLYQIIFNSLHFALIMPFIINEQSIQTGILYICATLPSFILTVPANKIVAKYSVNKVIIVSTLLCLSSAIIVLKNTSVIIIAIILILRSVIGCVFVPKISQFIGTQQEKKYSIFMLQLILFLPGTIGYAIALSFYKFNTITILVLMECIIVFALSLIFRKESQNINTTTTVTKKRFIFDIVIIYETTLITLITFISLFHVSSILI